MNPQWLYRVGGLTMTPGLNKFALTAHVTFSVGWLGAVAGWLALAAAGLTSLDAQMTRAAYLAMELTAWLVIVPLSLASPLTGLVLSLGTTWGLLQHYWVLAKFLITVPATVILLAHMQPISYLADVAATTTLSSADLGGLRIQMVADSGAALLVLLVATALAVYKPRGRIRLGRPYLDAAGNDPGTGSGGGSRTPRWVFVCWTIVMVLFLLFVVSHLTGTGLGGHTP